MAPCAAGGAGVVGGGRWPGGPDRSRRAVTAEVGRPPGDSAPAGAGATCWPRPRRSAACDQVRAGGYAVDSAAMIAQIRPWRIDPAQEEAACGLPTAAGAP